jgi:hypothetical protein
MCHGGQTTSYMVLEASHHTLLDSAVRVDGDTVMKLWYIFFLIFSLSFYRELHRPSKFERCPLICSFYHIWSLSCLIAIFLIFFSILSISIWFLYQSRSSIFYFYIFFIFLLNWNYFLISSLIILLYFIFILKLVLILLIAIFFALNPF